MQLQGPVPVQATADSSAQFCSISMEPRGRPASSLGVQSSLSPRYRHRPRREASLECTEARLVCSSSSQTINLASHQPTLLPHPLPLPHVRHNLSTPDIRTSQYLNHQRYQNYQTRSRQRHQTLAYGVDKSDLDTATELDSFSASESEKVG